MIFQDTSRYFKTPHFRDISVTNNKFLSSISNLKKATIKDDIAVFWVIIVSEIKTGKQ